MKMTPEGRAEEIVTKWLGKCESLADWDDTEAMDDLSRLIAAAIAQAVELAVRAERAKWVLHILNGTGFSEAAEIARTMNLQPALRAEAEGGRE